jgi:hypothetical protein
MFNTVHAGGEQGWKSDHLEPFLFWPGVFEAIRARMPLARLALLHILLYL